MQDPCIWAGVRSILSSSESSLLFPESSVLHDAGPAAVCDSTWQAQCTLTLAAEPQERMGDPASCRHHSEGNDLTRHAGANLACLTTYSVTRPDTRAPDGYTRPTDQSIGTTILLQGRVKRPLPGAAAVEPSSKQPRPVATSPVVGGDGGGGDDGGGGGGDGQRALPVAAPEAAVEAPEPASLHALLEACEMSELWHDSSVLDALVTGHAERRM